MSERGDTNFTRAVPSAAGARLLLCGRIYVLVLNEKESLPIENYKYRDHLGINKVIEISEPPEDRRPELERMTYEDSNGERHVVEFSIMAKCPGISTDN
ncbi:DUF2790 domain-containing protein [Azotobacter beijerinckii]|uniref:DUF2790 domain-containing protein n=1 Tax=Azotobacter beijerinckii TaxID=170623 RepID=UPI00147C45FD